MNFFQVMMTKKRYEISALKDAGVKEKMNSVLKGKFTEMHKRREEAVASGVVLERMYDEFEKLVQEALQETIPIDGNEVSRQERLKRRSIKQCLNSFSGWPVFKQ